MGNFDRVKNLLIDYGRLFDENNNLSENLSSSNLKRIVENNAEMDRIRKEVFVTDWQCLIEELSIIWNVSVNDLVVDTFYRGASTNIKNMPLSYLLMEGYLFILDENNPQHHHFGIGSQAYNRSGGKFLLDANSISDDARAEILFSNGEFRSVVNDVNAPQFKDVKISSNIFKLFRGVERDNIKDFESLDDVGEEHLLKNWRIFLKACDRYAEKLKTQENQEM